MTAQADRWDKAIVRKDRAAIEANMADDFRQIDGAGNVETRQSFVDGVMAPELEIAPYTVEDFDARVYGDVAFAEWAHTDDRQIPGQDFQHSLSLHRRLCPPG